MRLSIDDVVQANLCHGCGACAASADVEMSLNALGFARPANVDLAPGASDANFETICSGYRIEQDAAGRHYDDAWGPMISLWTGHSTDDEIRFRGSSGGVISAIAIELLETKVVDFVVHTRADPDNPLGNVTTPSYTRAEVLAGAGSRYAPSSPLADLQSYLGSGKRFAFIGKPCDIASLRLMAKTDPRIDAQIPLMLSFFCAGIPSRFGARAVIEKLGVKEEDLQRFEFRGRGWPGLTRATRADGSEETMDYNSSWGNILSRHVQFRCKICPDGTGEFADIVCADAWYGKDGYPDFAERDGRSLVMARTPAGAEFLARFEVRKAIVLEPLEPKEIELMQPYQRDRKRAVLARLFAMRLRGALQPVYRNLRLRELTLRCSPIWLARNMLGTFRRLPRTPPGS